MPRTRTLACALAALVSLPACATGPGARSPAAPPTEGRLASAISTSVRPGDGRRVSLAELTAHAEEHSPLVVLARARKSRGAAEVEAARAVLASNPELRAAVGPRFNASGVGSELQLSFEQRFEIGGEPGLRRDAAEAFEQLTRLELEEARALSRRLVHSAYFRAIVARERAKTAARVLEFADGMLAVARRRHAAGDVSAIDVGAAENEVAQARQMLIRTDSRARAALLTLAEAAGWLDPSPPEPSGELGPPRDAPPVARLLELAQRHNPKRRTLAQARRVADARAALADGEAWPEPALGLSYTREADPGAGSPTNIALLTLAVPLPVWQTNQGERARARAEASVARAEQSTSDRALALRIVRAADAVNTAAARLRAYGGEILPGFEQKLQQLQKAFELGELDFLELLIARSRLLELRSDALGAHSEYHDARATLDSLVGSPLLDEEAAR